ncbi:MAG TPA: disulfide bond formation regulator [Flavobacteriaceae bacterium]|nr:disulfide bond formation regulator [Flavobacteriaceae bacterium]HAT63955.1 disulfide bond formation regulator [Flavobacteriaceae bacterium]|tara:strand:- start:46919 stop:47338 length:420 start_codon:yes stop_codon:yes gene_type:complete
MKVTLNRINEDYLLEGKGENNISVLIDNKTNDEVHGASPMELLLMAVGGCNAIDIIYVLKKQRQVVDSYKVEVVGTREEVREAKPFKSIHVTVYLEGDIAPAKALRAASLSFEKYCSVSITLEKSVKITYEVVLNGTKI